MILYQTLVSFLLLTSPLVILFRILKKKEDKNRFIEKFSLHTKKRNKGKLIWFHGASVGEILSVLPLIKKYEKDRLIGQILITSSTVSSANLIQKYKFKKTIHQYYPIDHIFFTHRFLNYWKPNIAMFIDSEIWPFMFKSLEEKNIPLILLNARITKKTFERWMLVKPISRFVFSKITEAFPQNLETKKYLKRLKVKKISEVRNLKLICSHINSSKKEIILTIASKQDPSNFYGDYKFINYIGFISREELEQEIKKSDFLLILEGFDKESEENIPAKIFEYLGYNKPIMANCSPNSEIVKILNETGAGKNVNDYNDFENFLSLKNFKINNKIKKYYRENQFKKYLELIEKWKMKS